MAMIGVFRDILAIVMDTSVSFDREIVVGAAQSAREAGDWQRYVEKEHGRRLPNLQGLVKPRHSRFVRRSGSRAHHRGMRAAGRRHR